MGVLPKLFKVHMKVDLDLDPFYAKVKFGHIGFCMGKTEKIFIFWKQLQPWVSKLFEALS